MKRTDDVYDRHIFFYNRFGVFVEFSLYDAQRVLAERIIDIETFDEDIEMTFI